MSMEYNGKQAHWAKVIENVIGSYYATGVIYNADWQEAKRCCNNLIESTTRKLWEDYLNKGHRGKVDKMPESYWHSPYMTQLLGYLKLFAKDLKVVRSKVAHSFLNEHHHYAMYKDQVDTLTLLQAEVTHIQEAYAAPLLAMKDRIVKGRKKGERKTPERTLDHTGTCVICRKNVKMTEDEALVDHGFTIDFGQRLGHCFGVGYKPIELSPCALQNYLAKVLEPWRDGRIARKNDLVCKPMVIVSTLRFRNRTEAVRVGINDALYEKIREEELQHVEREYNNVTAEIIRVKTAITCWAAKPLPGVR
jgi:hypothetical protein